jgi:hypothetical protein
MASPGSIGDTWIDVHANTDPFERELPEQLDRVADDAERQLDRSGQKMGDKLSDGIERSIKRRRNRLIRTIENVTRNTVVRVRSVFRFDNLRDAIRRRFRRDVGDSITEEIGDAFNRSARSGVLVRFTEGIRDAVGAGFNISGRSPLISILLPAILALVGVIVAAIQAANSLVAVLTTIPTVIFGIGLQVATVALAFKGLGTAIEGAFAAKNAKELRKALKGLTPAARNFVRQLLPLRDFFKQLQRLVQESFFRGLGDIITPLLKALGGAFLKGFPPLARAMGQFFRDIALFFASPNFLRFVDEVFPATVRWLGKFGPAFVKLLDGITEMSYVVLPFLEKVGDILIRNIENFAYLLRSFSGRRDTTEWLDHMAATLSLVFDLLFRVGEFLFVFFQELDRAGGALIIEELLHAVSMLTAFLASPVGRKAMEALVHLSIFGIQSFTGLLIAILSVMAGLEKFGEWFQTSFLPRFISVIKTIGQAAVDGATFVGVWATRIVNFIGGLISWAVNRFLYLWNTATGNFSKFVGAVREGLRAVGKFFSDLLGIVLGYLSRLGTQLFNVGYRIMGSFISGIRARISELANALSGIAGLVGRFLGASPAKEGPLSGRGWTRYRGQSMIQDLIQGIRDEMPDLRKVSMNAVSNIVFGSNSVQVNVAGGMDRHQAQVAGSAMGMSAANMIAARNTRLAVRTL